MFTGIVAEVGTVRAFQRTADGGAQMEVTSAAPDLVPGESVAVDGACLTVEQVLPGGFRVHLVGTTVERTRFGDYMVGQPVNLERAVRAGDRLGGHLVQGHVDGVAEVVQVAASEAAWLMDIQVPASVWRVSVPLGSITVDGVSLTVNARSAPAMIQVSLVPYTLQHTTLGARQAGDRVHVEGDVIGKYVEGLLGVRAALPTGPGE